MERKEAIAAIKTALKRRSGKTWSVTGGTGTGWGWLTISAPPARCTWKYRLLPGHIDRSHKDWEAYDSGETGWYISPAERQELADLLGLDSPIHDQGQLVDSMNWENWIDRAEGRTPSRPDYRSMD